MLLIWLWSYLHSWHDLWSILLLWLALDLILEISSFVLFFGLTRFLHLFCVFHGLSQSRGHSHSSKEYVSLSFIVLNVKVHTVKQCTVKKCTHETVTYKSCKFAQIQNNFVSCQLQWSLNLFCNQLNLCS